MGSSTLLEAQEYDPRPERRRRTLLIVIIVIALCAVVGVWRGPEWAARWHARGVVSDFFDALQHKDFERAYGLWMGDATWKQHPEKHAQYGFNQFYNDWGPGGDWGVINNVHVDGTAIPAGSEKTIVVQVTVNERRIKKAQIWLNRDDNTLTEMSE